MIAPLYNQYCSFDVETTGTRPYNGDRMFSFCIGYADGNVDVYRLDRGKKSRSGALERLQDFFLDTRIKKIAHNAKFEMSFLRVHNIYVPPETEWHDTMIMSQLFRNNGNSHSLDYLGWELGGISRELDIKIPLLGAEYGGYQNIPEKYMYPYQVLDGQRPLLLFMLWFPLLPKQPFWNEYQIEIQLLPVVERMQAYGIDVCEYETLNLLRWLDSKIEEVERDSFSMFHEYINLNSPPAILNLLYKRYSFPVLSYTKTGLPSTGKDVLLNLKKIIEPNSEEDKVIDLIIRHRSYTKGKAIVQGYLELTDKNRILHTNIKSNFALTGRLSSENPSLMNVSKKEVAKNPYPIPARRCFQVRKDHVLYFVDYVGLQMMLIIELSKCVRMQLHLKNGRHPHIEAASIFYGKHLPENLQFIDKKHSKKLYGAAKNAHFGLAFGCGFKEFATILNLTLEQARPGHDLYRDLYPEIAFLNNNVSREVRKNGFVITPFGRKLYIPLDKLYTALVYLIQGTEVGITKRAMVRLDSYFKTAWGDRIRLVLPVHDEIIFSVPRDLLRYEGEYCTEIKKHMTTMSELKTPLDVEYKISHSTWENGKELILDKV